MGIDARMFVRTPEPLPAADVRKLAADLHAALGDATSVLRPDPSRNQEGMHCLEIIERYWQDGPDIVPAPGEQFIEVYLLDRYYGPGYERGDWPAIYAVYRWLTDRIPRGTVWYGGDSSGVCADAMTHEFCKEMWRHFTKVGHEPYVEGSPRLAGDSAAALSPICDFCQRVMWNQMGGPGIAGYTCEGCDYHCVTRDQGRSFQAVEKF